jgi:Concanavalin A-like lectin/glucanases superfamily
MKNSTKILSIGSAILSTLAIATPQIHAGFCTPPPSGIISWWPAEGNGNDSVGTNIASVPVGVTYAPGEVGQGFNFDGGANRIIVADVPELNFGANQDFSIEAWIQPDVATTDYGVMSIVEKRIASGGSDSPNGYEFCLVNGAVACRFESTTFESTSPDLRDGFFHHVAMTVSRNSTTGGNLYVDGAVVLTFDPTALNGSLINSEPLRIGNHPALDLNCFFKGIIDEVSIYDRALSTNEIQAIYNAGSEGKCMSPCTPPPSDIISWWPAEGNANDIVSGNNGIATNITYTIGEVGNAFNFNGSNAYVRVPASSNLNVGIGNGFTFETWINPATLNPQPLAEWNSNSGDSGIGAHFWISEGKFFPGPAGCLYANLVDTGGGDHYFSTDGGVATTNSYQHIALTYDEASGVAVIYSNGVAVQTSNLGTFIPQTSFDFYLGGRPSGFGAGSTYGGVMDEPSLYNRALSSNEVAAIYNAGSGGKCTSHPYIPPPRTATATAEWAGAFVVGVDIIDGGAGYTNTPNVRFIGGGGTGAQASVTVSNGVVVAIDITNPGSGYTNTPVVVIDPPFIASPILGIASISILNFSNLNIGTNYQLQLLQSPNWINQLVSFKASSTIYTQLVAGAPDGGNYRLAVTPIPAQAVAVPQVINGFVVAVRILTGGSGYATPPAVTFTGNGNAGSNATAVAGINKSGVVTNITVINAGMGYVNPVIVQIDPPPVTALFPTVLSGVVINSSGLAPYDNYQIQFRNDMGAAWGNLSGGLLYSTNALNARYIFLTNNTGYFRLQYVP